MAERSSYLDTFRQHTYTPNSFYGVMDLLRGSLLDDIDVNIITTAPDHSASDINAALDDDITLTYEWELEVELVDSNGRRYDGYTGPLAINLDATVASTNEVAVFEDGSADTEIQMVNGYGTIGVIYGKTAVGDQWADADDVVFIVGDVLATGDDDAFFGVDVTTDTVTDTIQV